MVLILKGLLGAAITIALSLVARSNLSYLAGLIPLFPTFAIIAHVITFNEAGPGAVKETLLFGLLSIIPYATYLITMLLLIDKHGVYQSIAFSVLCWSISAFIIFIFWNNYYQVIGKA